MCRRPSSTRKRQFQRVADLASIPHRARPPTERSNRHQCARIFAPACVVICPAHAHKEGSPERGCPLTFFEALAPNGNWTSRSPERTPVLNRRPRKKIRKNV